MASGLVPPRTRVPKDFAAIEPGIQVQIRDGLSRRARRGVTDGFAGIFKRDGLDIRGR